MTGPRDIVARQLDRSGAILLRALEPLDDGEFYAENANGYSAAWAAGHLAAVCDLLSSWFDTGPLQFDGLFHRVFNDTAAQVQPGGVPAGATVAGKARQAVYYPKADLLQRFEQAVTRALRVLAAFDVTQWDVPAPGLPLSLATGGAVWEHLAVHCYWHSGELAGSMPRFHGTYTLNPMSHYFYAPPED